MSGVSGDFLVQLDTRLPDWSAGGLLRCSAARLSVCRCRSPKSTSTTRMTLLRTSSRGCHEDATRKTASVEFKLYHHAATELIYFSRSSVNGP